MAKKKTYTSTDSSSSITEAFLRHESFLKRFLSRFLSCPQDIEDVVQDTYLKAYHAEKNQEIHIPKAFLFRIARNEALKALEKKSRQMANLVEDYGAPEVSYEKMSMERQVEAQQKLGLICESVLEMSPQVRRVFLMRKVYGLSHREIAAQLGIAVSTVEKHVARGFEICNDYIHKAEQPVSPESGIRKQWKK